MAGNGPLPKLERQRPRDNKRRDASMTSIVPDGRKRGPRLPAEHTYGPKTVAWYEAWRSSPQAQLFESTDWLALDLVLPLVDAHYLKPSAAAASEIRLVTAALGGTYADRLRTAKIRIERPERESAKAVVGSNVTPINARRQSLEARLAADPVPDPEPLAKDPAPF